MRTREMIIVFILAMSMAISGYNTKVMAEVASDETMQNPANSKQGKNASENPETTEYAGSSSERPYKDDVTDVSIIQLIANPEKFNGEYVRLIGFVRLEFEGNAIYLHREDYEYGLTKNGIWLNITQDCCGNDPQEFDLKYVLVEGTFNAENYGHMGLFSGSIENIKRFEVWEGKAIRDRVRKRRIPCNIRGE